MITLRPEQVSDPAAIYQVNSTAFGRSAEADLVDALRQQGALLYSLVAVDDSSKQAIVGHLAISPVTIGNNGDTVSAVGLGPLAVKPDYQRRGIGSQLVRYWFEQCAREDDGVVVVLGHPEFYPRFGFKPAYLFDIEYGPAVRKEAFMVAELKPGALRNTSGRVQYHPAFNALG